MALSIILTGKQQEKNKSSVGQVARRGEGLGAVTSAFPKMVVFSVYMKLGRAAFSNLSNEQLAVYGGTCSIKVVRAVYRRVNCNTNQISSLGPEIINSLGFDTHELKFGSDGGSFHVQLCRDLLPQTRCFQAFLAPYLRASLGSVDWRRAPPAAGRPGASCSRRLPSLCIKLHLQPSIACDTTSRQPPLLKCASPHAVH